MKNYNNRYLYWLIMLLLVYSCIRQNLLVKEVLFLVTHVRGKTVHQMLVFIGLVCISFALVLGLSCIMLYQIFYLLGGTIGPYLQGCYIVTYLSFKSRNFSHKQHLILNLETSRTNSTYLSYLCKFTQPYFTNSSLYLTRQTTSQNSTISSSTKSLFHNSR